VKILEFNFENKNSRFHFGLGKNPIVIIIDTRVIWTRTKAIHGLSKKIMNRAVGCTEISQKSHFPA
jgi:hypothetical protein